MSRARAGVAAAALLSAFALAPVAQADGDPASDVLIYSPVFFSYTKLPEPSKAALDRAVEQANAGGYTVRVALIGNRFDLGSVPVFWRKPQPYAKFLSQELLGPSPYTNRVLVVMPNGFGLSHNGKPLPAERRALDSVATAEDQDEDIAAAGFRAVQQLAALRGVHVSGSVPRTGDRRDRLPVVVGAALGVLAVAAASIVIVLRLRRHKAPETRRSDG